MLDRSFLFIQKHNVILCVLIFGLGVIHLSAETLELGRVSYSPAPVVATETVAPTPVATKPVAADEVISDSAAA